MNGTSMPPAPDLDCDQVVRRRADPARRKKLVRLLLWLLRDSTTKGEK